MGRHSTAQAPRRTTALHRAWRRLPRTFRARVWEWRKRWRKHWDDRHIPPGEWDASLPKDAANWTDELNWGSVGVAAALRSHRRQRGDLLPEHKTQEQS